MAIEQKGYLMIEELIAAGQYPTKERFEKGPVAIAECLQEIPCNPCEGACKYGAIKIGEPITNSPKIDEVKCIGCTICVAKCPGLAIFVIDKTYSEEEGTVAFPHEYYPLPNKGDTVDALNRMGECVCKGRITKVLNPKSFDRTPVVTVAVPKDKVEDIRGIRCEEVYCG